MSDARVYNASGYSTQIMVPVSPEVLREPAPAIPVGSEARCELRDGMFACAHNNALYAQPCDRCPAGSEAEDRITRVMAALSRALDQPSLSWDEIRAMAEAALGTGQERVIPATDLRAKLHAKIAFQREVLPPPDDRTHVGRECARMLDIFEGWLDEYTAKAPTGGNEG